MTAFAKKTDIRTESHLIGKFIGNTCDPTLIDVGSVHSNEPSGRLALGRVARRIEAFKEKPNGGVYLLAGNAGQIFQFKGEMRYGR